MINKKSFEIVGKSRLNDSFMRPAYGSYCFAHIPHTIRKLFGLPDVGQGLHLPADVLPDESNYDRVILILVDALGWQHMDAFKDSHPFLKRMFEQGVASQLTSMFPSTTSAHITCLNTGQPPGQSGVHEWFYYEPTIDAIIAPLLYSYAGSHTREQLAGHGVPPGWLLPSKTLHQEMGAHGIASHVYQSHAYARSIYTQTIMAGAEVSGFFTISEALFNLRQQLRQGKAPAYYYLYFDTVDTLAHAYGPYSPQVRVEIAALFDQLETFYQDLSNNDLRTLLIITADHGQSECFPETCFRINERLPEFIDFLRRDQRDNPLYFGGSPHDLFLYIKPDKLEEAEALLSKTLQGRAEVYQTARLIAEGLFGSEVNQRLQDRIGNLVILPYSGESVIWHIPGKFENHYYGMHGGLMPEAMLIPFLAMDITNGA